MPGFMIGSGSGTDKNLPSATVEPRRTYRWSFKTLDASIEKILIYLKTCSRPNITLEPIEMHHNQERAYFAGRTLWEAIAMSWYDIEQEPDSSKAIWNWLKTVTDVPNANVTLPGPAGSGYKKTGDLAMTDHEGNDKEVWNLQNCWPTNINWNELDYSTNDIILITVSMRFDRANKTM